MFVMRGSMQDGAAGLCASTWMRVARKVPPALLVCAAVACALATGCAVGGVQQAASLASGGGLSCDAYAVEVLPTWFGEELFPPEGARDLYVDESGLVVGLALDVGSEGAFDFICREMGERGWFRLESGMEGLSTFVRERGRPDWAMISCIAVGDATSVVVQVSEVGS